MTIIEKEQQMEQDTRKLRSIYAIKKQNQGDTVFGTLQLQFTEYNNYRRRYKRFKRNTLARTTQRRKKAVAFASRFLSGTEKQYAINELELLAVVWGLEHFRSIYGKPIKLLTDHQALEPLIKRNG